MVLTQQTDWTLMETFFKESNSLLFQNFSRIHFQDPSSSFLALVSPFSGVHSCNLHLLYSLPEVLCWWQKTGPHPEDATIASFLLRSRGCRIQQGQPGRRGSAGVCRASKIVICLLCCSSSCFQQPSQARVTSQTTFMWKYFKAPSVDEVNWVPQVSGCCWSVRGGGVSSTPYTQCLRDHESLFIKSPCDWWS